MLTAKTSDEIIRHSNGTLNELEADVHLECRFGNETLAVGDEVKTKNKCVSCICKLPPMLHCITSLNC